MLDGAGGLAFRIEEISKKIVRQQDKALILGVASLPACLAIDAVESIAKKSKSRSLILSICLILSCISEQSTRKQLHIGDAIIAGYIQLLHVSLILLVVCRMKVGILYLVM